jgi:DNA repair exonuclease SbcCD nuclease subunit
MRTKPIQTNKTPSAILCSDIHLREQTENPTCRTDDWWAAQWKKIDFISDLQKRYDCPVIHAGDLFDHWKPSPHLLSNAIANLPEQFFTIYGQHDLPQHNLELAYKSGINTLAEAGKLTIMTECHFGQFPEVGSIQHIKESTKPVYNLDSYKKILVWHTFNFQGKPPWPGCKSLPASKLLKKYPEYALIVTGDNHQSFVEEYDGRICVNPGSMMRMTADQQDFRPSVYLWYTETNTVERIYLPIEPGVISREHIDRKQERDNRLEAFVSRLNTEWEADVSFEENVNRMMEENHTADSICEIVNKAVFE